eukprot:12625397-Alexandrium_andersonii.AAC.1
MSIQAAAQAGAAVGTEAAVERMMRQLRREGWAPTMSTDSLRPGRRPSMGGPFVQQLVVYRLALSGPG